ncbi:MAG: FkbM family methyltransferase [Sumerlaeia bacterium]
MLRTLVERATRSSVFRRRLPSALGGARFFVSASAGLGYLFRPVERIDPALCALAREFVHTDYVVWDVGANVGLFSFAAAHLAGPNGRVCSIEPDLWLVQLLRRSASQQPSTSAPVQVVPSAVAGACTLRTLNIATRSRATNCLSGYGSTQMGGVAEQQTVVTVTLDWLAEFLPPPDLVKIDVEGAELEVLRGAVNLLSSNRPIFLCEVCSENFVPLTSLFRECGYRVFDGEEPAEQRQELDVARWSTIAIPNSSTPPADSATEA